MCDCHVTVVFCLSCMYVRTQEDEDEEEQKADISDVSLLC